MSSHELPALESTADAVRNVSVALGANDFRGAAAIADAAIARGFVDMALYNARALWFERQGLNEQALEEFQRARALAPRSYALLNAIGLCLTRLYRLDEAVDAFDEAIRIHPAYSRSHQRRGVALGMAGRHKASADAFRRAVSLDPGNVAALASVASVAARDGDLETARRFADRALAIDSGNPTAHAALALTDISRGQFAAARSRLEPLLANVSLVGHGRAVVLGLLGDALDGENRFSEAFGAYESANQELRNLHAPRFQGKITMGGMLEQLTALLGESPPSLWEHHDEGDPAPHARQHVFLLGFYRSGTTLLEQVLESHPDVTTLEERDFLAEAADRYLTTAEGFERLSQIENAELERARLEYWARVRQHGIAFEEKVFVDKHPMNTAKLPLIRKLFPAARIVFAIRDPRDVVLSCFRRHFEINAVMHEFLTLEGTAKLYDRVMTFAETCREKMPFEIFDHRYEDLVSDFERQVRSVCGFLGLDFRESMADFAETARGLDIRSPSLRQVRRGLYKEGSGQWRPYAAELAPVLPVLAPWVTRFGYAGSGIAPTLPSSP